MENKIASGGRLSKKKLRKAKKRGIYFILYTITIVLLLAISLWFAKQVVSYSSQLFHKTLVWNGLLLNECIIKGNSIVTKEEVLATISPQMHKSMLSFSVWSLKQEIEKSFSCIKEAQVKRKFPNTLIIEIKEYIPFAIWNNTYVLDKEGNIIFPISSRKYNVSNLLKIESLNLTEVKEAIALILNYPEIYNSLACLSQIANRRWNLYLKNNTLIKLPEDNLKETFKKIIKLNLKYNLLNNSNIQYLDFRVNDKIFFTVKE